MPISIVDKYCDIFKYLNSTRYYKCKHWAFTGSLGEPWNYKVRQKETNVWVWAYGATFV